MSAAASAAVSSVRLFGRAALAACSISFALSLLLAGPVDAAPPKSAQPALPPLALLPSVARVKVTSHGTAFAVVQELNLPRGDWKGETLRFHVAFGAPGPRAVDAHLVPVGDGALEPDDAETGEVLPIEHVPRRPANAHGLLGRETMAGVVVLLKPDVFRRALVPGNMAALRIRSLVDATPPDASGASSVVVRLGAAKSTPLTLGRLVVASASPHPPLARVDARLCGPEADAQPLAVGGVPKTANPPEPMIAPVLAVRHATDDLCLRLWSAAR